MEFQFLPVRFGILPTKFIYGGAFSTLSTKEKMYSIDPSLIVYYSRSLDLSQFIAKNDTLKSLSCNIKLLYLSMVVNVPTKDVSAKEPTLNALVNATKETKPVVKM